jgi:hypothetical protein
MQRLDRARTAGLKKFSDAIVQFPHVIPDSDESAVLKGVCLLSRSACQLLRFHDRP